MAGGPISYSGLGSEVKTCATLIVDVPSTIYLWPSFVVRLDSDNGHLFTVARCVMFLRVIVPIVRAFVTP
jgi:hypothetical protein